MSSTILEFRDVSFSRGPRLLLDRLSFSIETQEMVALIGPNGVGKTTMLKLVARLLQPAGGSILLQGKPLPAWSRHHLPRSVALVPQELELPFNFRVEEIVAQGRVPYLPLFGAGELLYRNASPNIHHRTDFRRRNTAAASSTVRASASRSSIVRISVCARVTRASIETTSDMSA